MISTAKFQSSSQQASLLCSQAVGKMDLEDRHSVKLHNKLSPGNLVIESDFWILEAPKNLVPLSSSEKVNSTHAMSTCTPEQAFHYYNRIRGSA
jgi:hypothetical protein